MVLIYLY